MASRMLFFKVVVHAAYGNGPLEIPISTAVQSAVVYCIKSKEVIFMMSSECCNLGHKMGIPHLLCYRTVIFRNNFCLINFASFALFWLKSEEKLMFSSVWKIAFTGAALFCTTIVVTAPKDRLQIVLDLLIHLQMCPKVSVKTCLRLWVCVFQVRAAQQGKFVHLKGLQAINYDLYVPFTI